MKCLDLTLRRTMTALVSSTGLVVMLKALMHARGQCAVFLGITVLVTVIAADSPVAGKTTPFPVSQSVRH